MTDLERLVARLIEVLRARGEPSLHRPLAVAELRATVLPYRLHRTALGLSSAEDYDLLILRLLAEEGGWARAFPPEAATRARTEVAAANPDLELVETLGDATIQIGAATAARFDEPAAFAPPAAATWAPRADPPDSSQAEKPPALTFLDVAAPEPPATPEPPAPPPPPAPPKPSLAPVEVPLFESVMVDPAIEPSPEPDGPICLACRAVLPTHRPVAFCPFCGRQVGALRCPRCDSEIEAGWRHCVSCGLAAGPGSSVA